MNHLILVFTLFFMASADEDWKPWVADEVSKVSAKCLKENHVTRELILKLKDFEFADEDSIRCSIKCISETMGIWDSVTGYNIDRTFDQTTSQGSIAATKEEFGKCVDVRRDMESDCEWAFRNFKCWIDNKLVVPNKTN